MGQQSMEALLGLKEETTNNLDQNYKLVPWLNWDEWDFVRLSLFSSSPDSIQQALRRIVAWRSRGCLPVAIEVTASIVEIQQKDSHFRAGLSDGNSDTEEMLAMLYTMAVMRLVNGVIEKTRMKTKVSIAEAAAAIDIPRMLIDIRHEGSHRELPSLQLLRLASVKALSWLKSYYWDPQKKMIPYQRGKSVNVRKEVRSKLRELAFSLKVKQISGSSSSQVKRKRQHRESVMGTALHGRNKFFSLMACKNQPSKYVGSRKQLKRTLKNLIRLYSFFSSDVVSVLLEFLLRTSNSIMDTTDNSDNFQINLPLDAAQTVFDEWKPVITKFSKQEPEVLLDLLKAVLDMIESRKAIRDDFGSEHFSLSLYDLETQRIRVLSSLFTWLLLLLKGLKSPCDEGQEREAACIMPRPMLIELLRKCLYISDPENHELWGATVLLGKIAGSSYLDEKFHKLSLLTLSSSILTEDNPSVMKSEDLILQEKHISQAAKKLEFLKLRKTNYSKNLEIKDDNVEDKKMWTVAKSWNPCPIGMLPRAVGSSGYLPMLDCDASFGHKVTLNSPNQEKVKYCGKRESRCDIETMEISSDQGTRDTENHDAFEQEDMNVTTAQSDGLTGRLLIGGVLQKVGDQELQDIKYRLSNLVNGRVT